MKQHFQLAITILLWSVVMEYPQRCYFLVNPHNRTEWRMKLWTSLFVFVFFVKSIVVMFMQGTVGFVKKYTWSLS